MTMTREDAARRLGMSLREVTAVREHPAGHVSTLNGGRPEMLIGETAARRYIPEADDPAPEAEPETDVSVTQPAARKGGKNG